MGVEDPLRESVETLSRYFVGRVSLGDTLQTVVDLSVRAVPSADMAAITMLVDDKVTTAVFSDPAAPDIDQAQYRSGRGPCVEAFRTGTPVVIPSLVDDDRYPEFAAAALERGVASSLSLPLQAREQTLGALNYYSRRDKAFTDESADPANTFAAQAAVVLANAQAYWDARELSDNLTAALASRATIDQAKGILMARSNVSADEAFDMLRMASQRENRKLRDIAAEIVARYNR